MISKPPSNWSDQDKVANAAQSAVAVAQYATSATKRGFSLVRAVVFGGFALFWGFSGLAQFVIGGLGDATAAFGGIMVMLLAAVPGYFAWRNLKKALGSGAGPRPPALPSGNGSQQFAPEPAKFNASFGGERREVPNSTKQLIKGLLLGIALIPFALYLLQANNPVIKILGLVFLVCGPFIILKALRRLIGGSAAFSYDGDGITIPGWFGEKQLLWRDISDFSVRTVTTYAYGIIKTASQHSLYALKTGGGKQLLPTQFTGLDAEGLGELAAQLDLYRSGLAGVRTRSSRDYASAAPPLAPDLGQTAFGRIDTGLAPTVPFASRPGPAAAPSFGRRQGAFGDRVS